MHFIHHLPQALLMPIKFCMRFGFHWIRAGLLCAGVLAGLAEADTPRLREASVPGIWSPLSSLEQQFLNDWAKGLNNDPDTLLTLYWIAAGHSDTAELARVRKTLQEATAGFNANLGDERNAERQASLLNHWMHATFLGQGQTQAKPQTSPHGVEEDSRTRTPEDDRPGPGYREAQSEVATLLATGDFNCISASLLYALLLRYSGLDGEGALLPTHAFIEVDNPAGKAIEVETTSPHGINPERSPDSYARAAAAWRSHSALAAPTYADYRAREKVAFWQLGTRNMLHQHTHPDRMSAADRGRLAEISAYLDPTYEGAQINRLYFLVEEAGRLMAAQKSAELHRLIERVYATVRRDAASFSPDSPLQDNLFSLQLYGLISSAEQDATDYFNQLLADSLNNPRAPAQTTRWRQNLLHALKIRLEKHTGLADADLGRDLLESLAQHFPQGEPETNTFAALTAFFYHRLAYQSAQQQDWPNAVALLEQLIGLDYAPQDRTETDTRLGIAYANWGQTEARHTREAALGLLLQCEALHSAAVCQPLSEWLHKNR